MEVPNVTWNWMPFEKESLFRRGIGRNQAALNTNAHWVWFTDCDLMFRKGVWMRWRNSCRAGATRSSILLKNGVRNFSGKTIPCFSRVRGASTGGR